MKNTLSVLLLIVSMTAAAQDNLHCGTDIVLKNLYAKHPALKLKKQKADEAVSLQAAKTSASPTYLIPMVFHILHLNGPENISDAQVKDEVAILNRDYAKRNADTVDIIPAFKNIADSTKIQFALATRDPLGNCTNGIVHHYDTDTDWDDTSPTIYGYTWDPTKYLNVYVVRSITLTGGFSAAGYTYLPGTLSMGDPADAIVVLNNYFGSIGTGSAFLSRVLTHEAGHWFDLYHVFGGTNGAGVLSNCSVTDYVNDTPPTPGYLYCPNAAVPSQYQLCTPGVSENYQNYMDYSYCCRMFTQDQAARMQAALQSNIVGRDNLWTNANLIATGVINPTVPCVPIADFTYNRSKTCAGTPVTFKDASWNGQPTSYNWSFPGGTPSSSTFSAPIVTYATPGVYSVTYTASNAAGTSTPVTKTNIITVTNNTASYSSGWSESFETSALPNNDWSLWNSSGGANWQQSSDAAYTGFYSAKIDPTKNTRYNVTSMTGPSINMSAIPNPYLTFKVATAESNPAHINTLKVYSSTDCGNTWTSIYSKTGSALITSTTTMSPFIPSGPSEWRAELINLSSIASASFVNFKFEYTRDTIPAPNSIFIDDINIATITAVMEQEIGPLAELAVFPNPSSGNFAVSFNLYSKQNVKMTLTDLLGREQASPISAAFEAGQALYNMRVPSDTPKGIYFLKVDVNGKTFTRKILVE